MWCKGCGKRMASEEELLDHVEEHGSETPVGARLSASLGPWWGPYTFMASLLFLAVGSLILFDAQARKLIAEEPKPPVVTPGHTEKLTTFPFGASTCSVYRIIGVRDEKYPSWHGKMVVCDPPVPGMGYIGGDPNENR